MNVSSTLRNPARAASELNARFRGESSKGETVTRGPAGVPNRTKGETKTRRQMESELRARRSFERFIMPEHNSHDLENVAARIEHHRAMVSGNVGNTPAERSANSAKVRLAARLAGISAKMEQDGSGHRVNASDPFAGMRAECHARLGLNIRIDDKRKAR